MIKLIIRTRQEKNKSVLNNVSTKGIFQEMIKKYIPDGLSLFTGLLLIVLLLCTADTADTRENITVSKGQKVYIPAYSHIYTGNRQSHSLLTVTLSIRNTDMTHAVKVLYVNYYDTKGVLLKNYLSSPVTLKPLESTRYVVDYNDKTGGSGANFIVEWKSKNAVNPPIMETIMIGSRSSFTSRGQALIPFK